MIETMVITYKPGPVVKGEAVLLARGVTTLACVLGFPAKCSILANNSNGEATLQHLQHLHRLRRYLGEVTNILRG